MQIWYFDIDELSNELAWQILYQLPTYISKEIDRYYLLDDRKSRLVARLLIYKFVVESGMFKNWDWTELKRRSNNKPYIEGGPHISITHSGKITMVGFSTETELGVDIEAIKNIEVETLSQHFHNDEYNFLEKNHFDKRLFYKIWTRKEALLKAIGMGLINGLGFLKVMDDIVYHSNDWYIADFQFIKGYHFAICTANKAPSMQIAKICVSGLTDFIKKQGFTIENNFAEH